MKFKPFSLLIHLALFPKIRPMATATTAITRSTLAASQGWDAPRTTVAPAALGHWHSHVALGVFAIALSFLDSLHIALRVPPVRPPVIWWHLFVGLAWYPLFITVALQVTRRLRLDSSMWMRNAVLHVLLGLLMQYVHYLVLRWTLAHILWPVMYPDRVFGPKLILGIGAQHFREYPIDLLAYWLVIAFEHASRYYSALGERQISAAKLETRLAEARLESLRRQLSPHFLFNTLNTVSTLAMRGDREAVVNTITRLSDLLRVAIDEERPQLVPLRDELDFLSGYVWIQQVRFGERLRVQVDVAPEAMTVLVPSMILQPIAENAIEHGITGPAGSIIVTIAATVDEERLRVEVHDSGPGFSTAVQRRTRGHGVGLANTTQRLQQLYGRDHSIRCSEAPEGGATVELVIPRAEPIAPM